MVPDRTSCAPYQSTPTTQANTRKMAIAVSPARDFARALAAVNDRSTASPNRAPAAFSWVKACSTLTWLRLSLA